MNKKIILSNDIISVEFALPDSNAGSRFEKSPCIRQITLQNAYTFLGEEQTQHGFGTKGLGLAYAWQWLDASIYNKTAVGDFFPIIGVGDLKKKTDNDYSVKENHETNALVFDVVQKSNTQLSVFTEQKYRDSIDIAINRTYNLVDDEIIILTEVKNKNVHPFTVEEYNHNFFMFNNHKIDDTYEVSVNFQMQYKIIRGHLICSNSCYKPLHFEKTLGTIALEPSGFELSPFVTTNICNRSIGTQVTITDEFTPYRSYHWISPWSICPEYFIKIHLKQNEHISYKRKISAKFLK